MITWTDDPRPLWLRHYNLGILTDDERAVIGAIIVAGKPVTNDVLAEIMCVSKAEASKRATKCNGSLKRERVGREVRLSLA